MAKNTTQLPKARPPRQTSGLPRASDFQSFLGLVAVVCFAIVCFVVCAPEIFIGIAGLPEPRLPTIEPGVEIFDRNDQLVCTIYGDRDQQPLHLDHISRFMQEAAIAAEDHDFYQHDGINAQSILRAVLIDVSAHHALQGGSTISQQLIKNLYFEGRRRNFLDKAAEALMALELEKHYSKRAILEAYLNCVYFGHGAYGVESAAQFYFGKHASDLDAAQSAFLAGLVTAPSELAKPSNRKHALVRQHLVLDSMKQLGYLTAAQTTAAKKEKLVIATKPDPASKLNYYTSMVMSLVKQATGGDAKQGYRVYTFMDPQAQRLAQAALTAGIKRAPPGVNQGALVSLSASDGGVIAMVGAAGSYELNQWNRATSPHTVGSAFKPFVYLAALAEGALQPDAILDDKPLVIEQPGAPVWKPRNFDGEYMGAMTIRKAIALSRNTCAVQVAQTVGPATICNYAHKAGITAKLDPHLSLALGSCAVSPLEMANAYATLARGGIFCQTSFIRRIEDEKGKVLQRFEPQPQQVFPAEPVAQVVDAMQDVVERGTGTRAQLFDRPVAGKTGTADSARDLWFVGFTPDTVTAVWGGNDDDKPVRGNATGGSVMASIFQQFMRGYYRMHTIPAGAFPQPLHPLADETQPPPLQVPGMGILRDLFGPGPGVREYGPPPAPPRENDESRPRRPSLLHRFFHWLDM